jgi:membrane-bound lytic murein transglycosylase D
VGRKPVATVLGLAMLTGGCAQDGARDSQDGFPNFFNVSNWTSGSDVPDADVARAPAAPEATSKTSVAAGPQTHQVTSNNPHLAPVVERQFAAGADIDPTPAALAAAAAASEKTSAPDEGALWSRIRAGMTLKPGPQPFLKRYIKWIGTHDRYFKRVTKRSGRYLHYVTEQVTRRGMPTEIALLPIIESGYKPFAYSQGNAAGVWQIIPTTGKQLGLKISWWFDGRRDIVDATDAALELLTMMHANLDNDWLLALAAYNCGEGAVRRARARSAKAGKGIDYWSIRPFLPRETQAYVPRLLAVAAAVRDPPEFGLSLAYLPDQPYFDIVPVSGQVDLAIAARAAGIKLRHLQRLNPGFKRFATDPDGPHRLLIPRKQVQPFKTAMAALPASQHMLWQRHNVKAGESLGLIADRHQTHIDVLKQVNGLSSTKIRMGADLLVPVASQSRSAYALAKPPARAKAKKVLAGKPYIVRRGDSMWTIAKRHKTSVEAIARVNRVSLRKPLKIGQTIYLPADAKPEIAKPTATAPPANGQFIAVAVRREGRVYTVRAGDTLRTISKRYELALEDIRAWNQLRKGGHLLPGQILKLYSPADQKES